jgi:hypothetical protein
VGLGLHTFNKGKIMALKINLNLVNNFGQISNLTNCYCKVTQIVGDKTKINFKVAVMNEEKNFVYQDETFGFDPSVDENAKNFIAQAYEHLKTLPQFASAVDC